MSSYTDNIIYESDFINYFELGYYNPYASSVETLILKFQTSVNLKLDSLPDYFNNNSFLNDSESEINLLSGNGVLNFRTSVTNINPRYKVDIDLNGYKLILDDCKVSNVTSIKNGNLYLNFSGGSYFKAELIENCIIDINLTNGNLTETLGRSVIKDSLVIIRGNGSNLNFYDIIWDNVVFYFDNYNLNNSDASSVSDTNYILFNNISENNLAEIKKVSIFGKVLDCYCINNFAYDTSSEFSLIDKLFINLDVYNRNTSVGFKVFNDLRGVNMNVFSNLKSMYITINLLSDDLVYTAYRYTGGFDYLKDENMIVNVLSSNSSNNFNYNNYFIVTKNIDNNYLSSDYVNTRFGITDFYNNNKVIYPVLHNLNYKLAKRTSLSYFLFHRYENYINMIPFDFDIIVEQGNPSFDILLDSENLIKIKLKIKDEVNEVFLDRLTLDFFIDGVLYYANLVEVEDEEFLFNVYVDGVLYTTDNEIDILNINEIEIDINDNIEVILNYVLGIIA